MSAAPAFGDVAFTSLSSTGTYTPNVIAGINGTIGHQFETTTEANSFVATVSGDLSSIEVGINGTGTPSINGVQLDTNFVLSLVTGSPTGTVLATSGILTATQAFSQTNNSTLETWTYTGPALSLTAGTTYYLVAAAGDDTSEVFWNLGSNSPTGAGLFQSLNGGPYIAVEPPSPSAFVVNVTPESPAVPEPTTALFGLAVTGVCALARRRRR